MHESEFEKAEKMVMFRVSQRREYEPQIEENEYIGMSSYREKMLEKDNAKRMERMNKYTLPTKTSILKVKNEEVNRQQSLSKKDKEKVQKRIMRENTELLKETEQEENINYYDTEIMIKKINTLGLNQNIFEKFTPSYIETHFKEVKKLMDEIVEISKRLEQQPFIYSDFKKRNIIRFDIMELKEKCQIAFNTSLSMHGLCYESDGQLRMMSASVVNNDTRHLGDVLKDIIYVFKNAEYDREKNIVLSVSRQAFVNGEINRYNELSKTIKKNVVVEELEEKLKGEEETVKGYKDLIPKLIADYERFETLILLENERVDYVKNHREEVEANNKNYDLDNHFEDELLRLNKRITEMYVDKKEIIGILQKIKSGDTLDEQQKDYLSMFYGMEYEMLEEEEETATERKEEKELQLKVTEMCERLQSCRTKKHFLEIRRDVCTLASELEEMIERTMGTEEDFYRSKGIWKLKVNKVLLGAKKARAIYLITQCGRNVFLKSDILSKEEYNIIAGQKGLPLYDITGGNSLEIGYNDIMRYAMDLYNSAEVYMHKARKDFLDEKETRGALEHIMVKNGSTNQTNHEKFAKAFDEKSWTKERKVVSEELYLEKKETILRMANKIEGLEEGEEKQQQRAILKKYMADVNDYEIYIKMNKKFYLFGEPNKYADPLFRNRVIINEIPVFKKMSDQDMRYMLGCMSAGVFEEEEKNPLLRELYKEINMDGLSKYKEKMFEHYDYIYNKYGFGCPSIEFLFEHYQEWMIDFSSLTFDGNLIHKISGFFDMNNPKDRMLDAMMKIYEMLNGEVNRNLRALYKADMQKDRILFSEEYFDELNIFWRVKISPLVEGFNALKEKVND